MLGVIKALTDVCNYTKAFKQWLALCNKQLWSGTFSSGSITVSNTDNYQLFLIQEDSFKNHIGIKTPDNSRIEFLTWFTGSDKENLYTDYGYCTISNNKWTWGVLGQMRHQPSSSHGTFSTTGRHITKIIGLIPTVPQTLTKLGGGHRYCQGVALCYL